MTSTALALVNDGRYMNSIPAMAEQFARSGMCPDTFRNKPDDVAVIAYSLAALDVRLTFPTLAQCYVVHGKPGLMAQLQSTLAARHGVDIHPAIDAQGRQRSTPEVGIVEVCRPGQPPVEVTFTMAEANKAGLTKPAKSGERSMYDKWPTNMLVARATTRAISWYCPAAKLGLAAAGAVDVDELDQVDRVEGPGYATPPDTGDQPDEGPPPRSTAPDGSTIPEHLREPALSDDDRGTLLRAIDALNDAERETLRQLGRDLGIPNIRSRQATRAHGALMFRLISEVSSAGAHADVIDAEEVPDDVRDDQPETTYSPDDPERPFSE